MPFQSRTAGRAGDGDGHPDEDEGGKPLLEEDERADRDDDGFGRSDDPRDSRRNQGQSVVREDVEADDSRDACKQETGPVRPRNAFSEQR